VLGRYRMPNPVTLYLMNRRDLLSVLVESGFVGAHLARGRAIRP
jgi:hypothetical protein